MKAARWMTVLLTVSLFALVACKKTKPPETVVVSGVTLNLPKFQEVFFGDPHFETTVSKISMGVRYHQYAEVLKGLQSMASDPAISEQQKQVVAELTEQVKQLMAQPAAP